MFYPILRLVVSLLILVAVFIWSTTVFASMVNEPNTIMVIIGMLGVLASFAGGAIGLRWMIRQFLNSLSKETL